MQCWCYVPLWAPMGSPGGIGLKYVQSGAFRGFFFLILFNENLILTQCPPESPWAPIKGHNTSIAFLLFYQREATPVKSFYQILTELHPISHLGHFFGVLTFWRPGKFRINFQNTVVISLQPGGIGLISLYD